MNNRQRQKIEWLKGVVLLHDGLGEAHVGRHEYKKCFIVTENPIQKSVMTDQGIEWVDTNRVNVYVVSEVGRKDDTGTLASVLCRTYRHIKVGPRGGLKLVNAKHPSCSTGTKVVYGLVT